MTQSYNEDSRNMYTSHHHTAPYQQTNSHQTLMNTLFEPYMFNTLQTLINCPVVIETNRGTIRGTLIEVQPDHVVLEVSGRFYFVRIQQINWVMPSLPTHPHVPQPTHQPMT